jgi:type I restriction enzyme S subunit
MPTDFAQAGGAVKTIGAAELRRFRSYPAYKDSGVDWLGKIPTHWEVKPLRATVTSCQNGVWGDEPDGLHDIACVRVADFNRVDFTVDMSNPTLRSVDPRIVVDRRLSKGDLLLEKSGGGEKQPVGAVVLFDHELKAVCSNFIARMAVAKGYDPRFLTYLHASLYSLRINTRHIKQSTGIQNLDSSSYLREATGIPGQAEQKAIAAFLNHETAKIDALVAKKQELIEQLQEKRNAIIAEAISASPDVREVRLGYYVDLLPGYAFPSAEFSHDPDDVRLLRGVNVSTGFTRWDDVVYWPPTDVDRYRAYQLREGDIVFGMDRPWVGEGIRVAEIGKGDLPSLLLQRVARLRAKAGLAQRYLKLILSSPQFLAHFEPILTGVSVPHVSPEQILEFRVRLPEGHVQQAKCSDVQSNTDRLDSMCDLLHASIHRLRDFRATLISAAVTGKIDVREGAA